MLVTYYSGYGQYVDENGVKIEKTPKTHPYNYDGHVIYRSDKKEKANCTIYSDRLWSWGPQQFDELCMKHFGDKSQDFSGRDPEKIETMLKDYCKNEELKLIFIMQYCHSNGNPYWRFEYYVPMVKK